MLLVGARGYHIVAQLSSVVVAIIVVDGNRIAGDAMFTAEPAAEVCQLATHGTKGTGFVALSTILSGQRGQLSHLF
jgi:hypothetical protein